MQVIGAEIEPHVQDDYKDDQTVRNLAT